MSDFVNGIFLERTKEEEKLKLVESEMNTKIGLPEYSI